MTQDDQKRLAAEAAVAEARDGMVLGLGTGSTAAFAVEALGRRVRQGLRIVGIPTSERTAAQARGLGIALADLAEHPVLDLTIDGADEVDTASLDLVKGLGGALLREKMVATRSRRMVVVVDEGKLVPRLGTRAPVPVEIVAFGWEGTAAALAAQGLHPTLRAGPDGVPFRTDNGNLILDCATGPIADPGALHARIKAMVGVVETGLFPGIAARIVVGTPDGPRILDRANP